MKKTSYQKLKDQVMETRKMLLIIPKGKYIGEKGTLIIGPAYMNYIEGKKKRNIRH